MKYIRRQSLNPGNIFDDTVLQKADGNIELNPTQRVVINGDLDVINGSIPGPEVANVMYVTLDGNDNNSGFGEGPNQAKRTLKSALSVAQQGTSIFIKSGEYYEDNPLVVPPKVSIIGDNLRRVILRPLNGPVSYTITNIERNNQLTTITFDAPHNLTTADRVRVKCLSNVAINETDVNISDIPADDQISYRQIGANISSSAATGTVLFGPDYFLVNSQNYITGVVFKGLAAPAYCVNIDSDAIVDTSPYVQNCSNINGPWMRNGVEWLPFQTRQPDLTGTMVTGPRPLLDNEIDPTQVDIYGIDVEGGGSGMLIDGDRYSPESPIKSMVGDAFTQVAQGGIGFHVTNFGYMQLVSCFSVFCSKAFYTTRGGYLSVSNSVIDFGIEGFVADGYYLDPYTKGEITSDYYSSAGSVTVNTEGSGFSVAPSVVIEPPTVPGGIPATAVASIDPILGRINAISIIEPGSGYDFQPTITITPANGATATVNLAKNLNILVEKLANKPQVGSVMFLGNDPTAYYISATVDSFVSFAYDEIKWRDDASNVIDGVYYDVAMGTNYNAVANGRRYAEDSEIINEQLTEIVGATTFLKSAAQVSLISNATAVTRSNAAFDEIIDITENGEISADALVFPAPVGVDPNRPAATEQLVNNRNFLRSEIINWIDDNYITIYDQVLWENKISYIIDALCYDILYGGNSATVATAADFFVGTASILLPDQRPVMSAALGRLSTVAAQVVQEFVVTPSVGNLEVQDFSGTPASSAEATSLTTLVEIISDVIDANSLGGLPAPITPSTSWISSGIQIAINQLIADKIDTIDDMIDYVDREFVAPFKYDEQKYRRNIGYIIDAACSDAVFNTNHQSVYAGITILGKVTSREKQQIIASINEARDQAVLLTSNTTMQSRIIDACTVVVNIINIGLSVVPPITIPPTFTREPGFAEAASILIANKTFIQDELEAWIAVNYPLLSYNTAKCRRDIGYITDAMAYDITYDGNTQSINAALAYGEGSVIAGQVEETQRAYEYWQTIVGSIVKNIPIIPSAGNTTTQNTSISIGAPLDPDAPADTAQDLLQIIIDVIDHGTGYIPDPVTKPDFDLSDDPLLVIERTSILSNITIIQDNTINYVNDLFGGQITVSLFPSVQNVAAGTIASLHNVSTISSGATALEYVGAGVTYNALPFYGGEPDPLQERIERNSGKCFVVTSDQLGNYKIGAFFTVNAITGEVSIDAERLNLSGLASIGPFKRNGIPVGVQLREVSDNPNLIASTGSQDANTTPTQQAVATYVENRYLNKVATGAQTVASDISFIRDVQIRGGDLTTNQSTFNLLNDTATTVNAFGAGTAITIGDTTGTTTINNNLAIGGAVISAPQPIVDLVNTFTNTINFGGEAHTINIGAGAGTLTINNPVVTLANATNLNVDGADPTISSTSIGTLTLFNTAITEVDAFGAASTITIGATGTGTTSIKHNLDVDGDVNIDGGDLTVSTTTFNLANTTATTVAAFGAATVLGLGGGSGTTTVNNSLQVSNNTTLGSDTSAANTVRGTATFNLPDNTSSAVDFREDTNTYVKFDTNNGLELVTIGSLPKTTFLNTIDASNATNASVTFVGGVGISKQLYVETNLFVNGNSTLGNSRIDDIHSVEGTLTVNIPDNTGVAFSVTENTQPYITAITTNSTESVSIGAIPKLLVANITDSFDSTQGALIVEGGAAVKKNLTVGVDLRVDRDITATGDLAVNGGDLNTSSAAFNILNTNATAINAFGAATTVTIGAVTGTTTIRNANTVVTGDLAVNGGDITSSATTFNLLNSTVTAVNAFGASTATAIGSAIGATLTVNPGTLVGANTTQNVFNTIATTVNAFGAATTLTIGSATGTTRIRNDLDVDGDVNIDGGDLTVSTATFNLANTTATTLNIGGDATALNLGSAAGATATLRPGTLVGANDTQDVFNAIATTVNAFGAATSIVLGAATGTTNIRNDLDVNGDVNIDGGDLTVGAGTFNLANTTATTVNFAGAGTSISIGAATGTTTINNANTVVAGDLAVNGGDITTTSTGTATVFDTNATTLNIGGAATTVTLGNASAATLTLRPGTLVGANSTQDVFNTIATTVNAFGAAATLAIGAATGTTNIRNNLEVDGDLTIDGGDLIVSTTGFNLANTTATTVNAFGAATVIAIGAATGTTNIKHDLDVDGDVNIDGGDLTVSTTTFNLANTTATTGNLFGAATTLSIGAATGTTTINNANTVITGDLAVNGGDITTTATGTATVFNTNATAVDAFGAATTVNIGAVTGTTTINNANTVITGDLAVNGGDITTTATGTATVFDTNATTLNIGGAATTLTLGNATSATATLRPGTLVGSNTTQNVFDTVATTLNLGGAATTVTIGSAASATATLRPGTLVGANATQNVFDTVATTVNAFGAATSIVLGAATGTTNIRHNLDVDGDVNIDGGDLTVGTTTFNLANTTATTGNLFGIATGVNVGISAASASTLTYGPAITGNTFKLAGTTVGTVNYTTDVTSGVVNAWQSVTGTVNVGESGTINLGTSTTATTAVVVGGAFTGNSLKIASTTAGSVTLDSDVTTGSVSLFNNITTGTLNVAGAGASIINLGSTTSTVNIGQLALTTDLAVQYGGTGQSSFTTNGVIYGQNAGGLAVTPASVPGSNATTSFGILTTDAGNVPVWTDTIDGGSY